MTPHAAPHRVTITRPVTSRTRRAQFIRRFLSRSADARATGNASHQVIPASGGSVYRRYQVMTFLTARMTSSTSRSVMPGKSGRVIRRG